MFLSAYGVYAVLCCRQPFDQVTSASCLMIHWDWQDMYRYPGHQARMMLGFFLFFINLKKSCWSISLARWSKSF